VRNGEKLVLESQFNQVVQTLRAAGGMIGGPRGAVARAGAQAYNIGLQDEKARDLPTAASAIHE
jgi:hypothetical protein